MNMQYSPRTESMIAVDSYAEIMRGVALKHEIPLFDRLAGMKTWSDEGTFDLSTATQNSEMAEQVHVCIGRFLADLVVNSVEFAKAAKQGKTWRHARAPTGFRARVRLQIFAAGG